MTISVRCTPALIGHVRPLARRAVACRPLPAPAPMLAAVPPARRCLAPRAQSSDSLPSVEVGGTDGSRSEGRWPLQCAPAPGRHRRI